MANFPDNFDWAKLFDLEGVVNTRPKASISFMITRRQRARLSELGYSDEAIFNMKPGDAHDILAGEVQSNETRDRGT